jgi:hypothetical protein
MSEQSDNHHIDLFGLLRWVFVAGVIIYQFVLITDLRWRVQELEQAKPAFYTVTDRGKEILMVQIK